MLILALTNIPCVREMIFDREGNFFRQRFARHARDNNVRALSQTKVIAYWFLLKWSILCQLDAMRAYIC